MDKPTVAVIGAGYAGLAAAVELVRAGVDVTVFESSRVMGGRARVVEKDGLRLDNGQHILLGAYTETLKLLRFLKVPPKRLLSLPLTLHVPGRLNLRAAALPAPFHLAVGLLTCRELSWADRLAAIRLINYLKRCNYALREDFPVSILLDRTRQTPLLRELVWDPLCVAALNTPAQEASAQVFATVLRDSVGASASASEMLIPRVDLTELLPVPAGVYLGMRGCSILTANPIKRVVRMEDGFHLEGDPNGLARFSHVVLAVAPYHVNGLLEGFDELKQLRRQIDNLPHEPISTVYLAYDKSIRLPEAMIQPGGSMVQWLFDRGQTTGDDGLLAGVISSAEAHQGLGRDELALQAHLAVERVFPRLRPPQWTQVITEKRATFACRPGLSRPLTITPVKNLFLAGDYVDSPYPATIEAAVRSGLSAARQMMRTAGITPPNPL
jgi:squalene-associated FAD-dependent desaturase